MPRRSGGVSELRELLAAHHAEFRERWDATSLRRWERSPQGPRPEPSEVSDYERALLAGTEVAVSSDQLFRALHWAGRSTEAARYGWHGPDAKTRYLLRGHQLERV